MTKPSKAVQKACQVLRNKVRYKKASFRLPGTSINDPDDTGKIRECTRLFVETWIVPILDGIESGDTKGLNLRCLCEPGDKMGD